MFDIQKTQKVTISHPLVHSAYLKTSTGFDNCEEDILVLETYDRFDSYLIELLKDLQDLKDQAERKVGPIGRLDIRKH